MNARPNQLWRPKALASISVLINALALLMFAMPASAQSRLEWQEHRDSQSGLRLNYPADLFRPDPDRNSPAGRVFVTDDGAARLLIGALENVDRHTPASYQKFISSASYKGASVDYAPVGQTWTVLSGIQGDSMFYQKVVFTCGFRMINTFALTYPVAERAFFDPIVEAIEDSFRAGAAHCDVLN